MLSYELVECLTNYIQKHEIEKSMRTVKNMYNRFPKEEDCITSIVLTSLKEELINKDLITFLINYLNFLKRTQ